ncbi:MAG: exosortase A, partial [Gemmatimonadales bacterium]
MSVISNRLEGTTNRRPHAEPTAPVVPEAPDRKAVDIVHQAPAMLRLPWRLAAPIIGIGVVALVGLYWEAAAAAVGIWYVSSTYNHGFLIPLICAYLIWTRRQQLASLVPRANYWGLATIVLLGFGWLLGHLASVLVVQQFALVAMVQALFLTVLGWRVTSVIAFPLLYLFFAVPVGDFLIPPLQDLTAAFVVAGLRLTGIPVFLDGVLITIPTGSFEVARACAGVRYLIATLALGILISGIFYRSWPRRLVFVGLSIMVPIIANGFRAYGIVMIAHLSEYRLAVAVDHVVYGWVFFGFVTLVLLLLAASIRERGAPDWQAVPFPAVPVATSPTPPARLVLAGVGAVLVAAAAPAYAWYLEIDTGATKVTDLPIPAVEAPWVPIVETDADWKPIFPGAGAELLQRYGAGERTVDLYIAYYPRQRQ